MLTIRPALPGDQANISQLLELLDQADPEPGIAGCWVAVEREEIIGVVSLAPFGDILFLKSLGVRPADQGKGLACQLMQKALAGTAKDIYLYTVIPDFFQQFGFLPVASHPKLPEKTRLECDSCYPDRCVTMRRRTR